MSECQYIGSDQDPLRSWPVKYCGKKSLEGKSYCEEHYYVVYKKGSSNLKNNTKAIEAEIAELKRLQEIEEIDNV
jgi:hypothetical protein